MVTNRSGMHLEDVHITGVLRTKLARRHNNVKPLRYSEAKTSFLYYYMGPFSWHLESKDVLPIWKSMLSLMTASVDGKILDGFYTNSKRLFARLTKTAIIEM